MKIPFDKHTYRPSSEADRQRQESLRNIARVRAYKNTLGLVKAQLPWFLLRQAS